MPLSGITKVSSPLRADESPAYCNSLHPNEPIDNFLFDPVVNCWELFVKGLKVKGKDRNFVGTRVWIENGPKGEYEWLSYGQVADLAARFVLNISRLGLCYPVHYPMGSRPNYNERPILRCLGLFTNNRVEWLLAEQAANIAGLTLVPLYHTFGSKALEHIIRQTLLNTIIVSWDSLPSLLKILDPEQRFQFDANSKSVYSNATTYSVGANNLETEGDVSQYVKNIILLPPYPCTHPIHLLTNECPSFMDYLVSRSIPEIFSAGQTSMTASTEGLFTPIQATTTHDTTDGSSYAIDAFTFEYPSNVTNTDSETPKLSTTINRCPDCRLGGCLWESIKSDIQFYFRCIQRLGIRLLHWAECIKLPASDKSDIGELASSIFPSEWYLVWKNQFDLAQLQSLSKQNTVQTICYTSGTTGNPKGVMITHGNLISVVASALRGPFSECDISITEDDCHISYLPLGLCKIYNVAPILAHIFERVIVNLAMAKGARVGIFGGDVHRLLSDIAVLQPTVFVSVPRVFARINDKVISGLKAKSRLSQRLFHFATQSKLSNLHKNPKCITHPLWDRLIFNKMKFLLGGRIRYLLVGGAPLDPLIQQRMTVFFSVPLLQGYGLTESMGAAFNTRPCDPAGYVGVSFPSIRFKLQSVPELNYHVHEKPSKGELLIQGPSCTDGYFCEETLTKELFQDGWLKTGDIVELNDELGLIRVIDRRKNLFKLVQGEYIAPEKLEGVYQQAALVEQIFVFGYSSKAYLVGVVVPDTSAVAIWCQERGLSFDDLTLSELCSKTRSEKHATLSAELQSSILEQLHDQAKSAGLQRFENIRDITTVPYLFTAENDLLTPTLKLKRHHLLETFKADIDGLFTKIESN